jgi:hypothetical protein
MISTESAPARHDRSFRSGRLGRAARCAPLRESKRTVFTLAALFGLDAFGGGPG